MRFLCLHGRGTNAKVCPYALLCTASHPASFIHTQLTNGDQIFEMQTGKSKSVAV